jgi:ribonuclease P protein component
MLPQEHRLKQDKDIKTLFAKGKSVFGNQIGLKYAKNGLPVSRFAVIVGSKVSKSAVDRNRLKRQIRAILQKHVDSFAGGFDVMLLTRKETLGKKFVELEGQLLTAFKKTPLLPK